MNMLWGLLMAAVGMFPADLRQLKERIHRVSSAGGSFKASVGRCCSQISSDQWNHNHRARCPLGDGCDLGRQLSGL